MNPQKAKTRVITALVVIAVVLPPLIKGGLLLEALIAFVLAGASYEATKLKDAKPRIPLAVLFFAASAMMSWLPEHLFFIVGSLWLVLLIALVIASEDIPVDFAAILFLISMIAAQAVRGLLGIYSTGPGPLGMLYVGFACYLCDAGAWLIGSLFGKHKMIPRISPNKTWEGAAGGLVLGCAGSALFAYFTKLALPMEMIAACSLILPPVSMIGDLAFSLFKRYYGIKDYSNLLPGHGGVLDRVDSLLFCLMVFNGMMFLWGIV